MNVSVIIPLYNAEKYISKALDSCLGLKEVRQIIVIDDGYKDNAKAIVKAYQDAHPIIELYEHPNNENRGAGESRNVGIRNATQDYIAFLDADDFYLPNRFQKDVEIFQRYSDAEGCYSAIGSFFYSEESRRQFESSFASDITTVNPDKNPTPQNLLVGLLGMIPEYGYFSLIGLTLKRKTLLKANIWFGNLRIHQDTVFNLRIAHYLKLYPSNINCAVALRGVHEENRITANNNQKEEAKASKRHQMWIILLNWAKEERFSKEKISFMETESEYYSLLSKPELRVLNFIAAIAKNKNVLKGYRYLALHKKVFGEGRFSTLLFKIRNRVLPYI